VSGSPAIARDEGPVKLSRRRFLSLAPAAGVTLALAAEAFVREPNTVVVTRRVVRERSAPSDVPITIAHLSDLHLSEIGRRERRVAELMAQSAPSVLLITGDSIDREDKLQVLDAFLGQLDPRLPKFAVLGNWEYFGRVDMSALQGTYERHNCRLLVNESVRQRIGGAELLVTGLDDWLAGKPDLQAALGSTSPHPNHVLLAHCPVQRDLLIVGDQTATGSGNRGSDTPIPQLVLSGHTHGGQVNLLGWCPWRPKGSGRYVSGWYPGEQAPDLYVSRGIGTVEIPVRLGAPPEFVFLEWHASVAV
jgi:predicted MPP superfamily phosphohydrolase